MRRDGLQQAPPGQTLAAILLNPPPASRRGGARTERTHPSMPPSPIFRNEERTRPTCSPLQGTTDRRSAYVMDPDDAACAAFADGDLSAAIRSLDSAISVCEPNSVRMAWCLVNRAECEVQLELFKRAQKDCDEALAIDPVGPAAPRACLLKGVALQHLGKKKCRSLLLL